MIETPARMQCAAHNAQKKPCGNLAVPGGLYCASHQPQAGDEYPEAEEEEELDAESRLTMAARRVGSHVEEATTVAEVGRRLMGAFDVLLQMTSEQVTGGVEAIREMVEVIASDRDELRRDLDFLLADFNLDEEQRQLLSERLTWDEDSIACLIDPNISIRVKELAHGRSTEPSAVINGALQYCIENEAL